MVEVVELHADGDGLFAALPVELIERWNLKVGDRVLLVETERGILIKPYDEEFVRVMEAEKSPGISLE